MLSIHRVINTDHKNIWFINWKSYTINPVVVTISELILTALYVHKNDYIRQIKKKKFSYFGRMPIRNLI